MIKHLSLWGRLHLAKNIAVRICFLVRISELINVHNDVRQHCLSFKCVFLCMPRINTRPEYFFFFWFLLSLILPLLCYMLLIVQFHLWKGDSLPPLPPPLVGKPWNRTIPLPLVIFFWILSLELLNTCASHGERAHFYSNNQTFALQKLLR